MRSNLGGEPPYDFGDFDDFEEMGGNTRQFFITGIASFLITTIVYSGILYYLISVLNDSGIISGEIAWTPLCISVTLLNFMRLWDRAFLRRK